MKTFFTSNSHPLAARPSSELQPRTLQPGHHPTSSPASKPAATAEHDSAAELRDAHVAHDLGFLARVLWPTEGRGRVLAIFGATVVTMAASMFGQVRLNEWNGRFFDALERKDISAFGHELWLFAYIIAALLTVTVAQTLLQERLKFRLREWITRHLLAAWLRPMRAYQLGFVGHHGSNPDQRIQEDTRLLGDLTAELGCGLVSALMQITAFIGVLWVLSDQVTFQIAGRQVAIPGYMVWCVLAYTLFGSGLTWLVGRPLIGLNAERYAREAELRFAVVRVNEASESVALHGGEKDERRNLEGVLGTVISAMRQLSLSLSKLTWITSGTSWLLLVIPILVAAPAYFAGNLTLGGLIMVAGAFGQVQWAMRWFVDNFPHIANWRAAVYRVARFREAIEALPAAAEDGDEIAREPHPDGHLTFRNVRILLPEDGHILIEDANATIVPGERVLIVGESGAGKSTLFRAVAGLWPWGSGTILLPPPESMAFLPQRPYLPLGTLRAAVTYPHPPEEYPDDDVRAALERCNLGELASKLDQPGRWDKELSLGEQQRLAFARLLLQKPTWVFLDEATAALDEANQRHIMGLFDVELKHATFLSIGHRPDLADYHTRTLQLVHGRDGARLKLKAASPRARSKRWQQRLGLARRSSAAVR